MTQKEKLHTAEVAEIYQEVKESYETTTEDIKAKQRAFQTDGIATASTAPASIPIAAPDAGQQSLQPDAPDPDTVPSTAPDNILVAVSDAEQQSTPETIPSSVAPPVSEPEDELSINDSENKVTNTIMSKLDISLALKFIPEYDSTKGTCSVTQFIACCDTIYKLILPEEQNNFVNLLHTKLRGKAYSILEYNPNFTWTDIKKELQKLFLENRTYEGILSELLNCKQNADTVLVFANRVEKLKADLNNACIQLLGVEKAIHARVLNERIALKGFEDGLKAGLKLLVKARAYKTLHDASTYAIMEDKQYMESHNSNSAHLNKKKFNSATNNSAKTEIKKEPKASFQGTKVYCSHCKKKGHTLQKCRNKPTSSGNASGQNTADSCIPASKLE